MKTREVESSKDTGMLDRSDLARKRARIYHILSVACFGPADEALLEAFRSWSVLQADLPVGSFSRTMRRGLRKVSAWLEEGTRPAHERLLELDSEFVRLFRGLSPQQSPPPPYESVYMDGGHVYGLSTDQVSRTYHEFSLACQDNEPPDHLALELDFMRFLCEGEAEAWQDGGLPQYWLQAEQRFLGEHLGRWASAFCGNVRKWCRAGFYSGVADITESWISCDQDVIAGLVTIERDDMVLR